ncbi:MAG: nitrate- and nitrite sensing domain-containing protein [Pseudonocardiaceae bacterium]
MTEKGAALSGWHWRNWPVLVKLVAVLLVPTLVALVVGVLRVTDQAGAAPAYIRISQIADVQQKLSDLVGAIQRERDLATAFVATGRSGDQAPLDLQFRDVADRSAAVRAAADQVEGLAPTGYATALDDLRGLRTLRTSVLSGFAPVEVVVVEYGAAIDPLIELDAALVRQLDDVAVSDDAAAAHALLVGREQVNRQHAIILAALYANRVGLPQINDVQAAAIRLGTEQDQFAAALDPVERAGYVAGAFGDAELLRQRLVQLVLDRGLADSALNISPDDWSARTAAAAADVTGVGNELRQRVDRTALALRDDARATAGWNAVILIFALALGVFIGILIARSMLRPLGVLKRTALDVADRRLPDAMSRVQDGDVPDQTIEPVAVGTREEIGQVARAFDEVHRQAVRLAGEQAKLRAHVNDIFVNLSRRSQGLVERQLQLIDRLESSEQDPAQLDNLFQLDHLATRMRRNSDNLLVLAGTEVTKRASRPVRLVDVQRAAVSEVEQYQRLVLQQPPGVLVLGRTAGDLVHLLAELLDNATQFSPPDTHVMVSAELAADGSVSIEVMDRGVGMTDTEVTEANARLAGTPVVDASVSRRMGLFVVGRLAVRHGIRVRLRRGDDGIGICASVSMPPRLVRSVTDSGELRGTRPAPPTLPALPAGTAPDQAPMAHSSAESGVALVPREYRGGSLGGPVTNGNGVRAGGPSGVPEQPSGSALPRRSGDRSVPDEPPPATTGSQVSPPSAVPAAETGRVESGPAEVGPAEVGPAESGPVDASPVDAGPAEASGDLFRPGGLLGGAPAATSAPAGPAPGGTLQHSTPIFDDVASAWFREHQAVPVRWASGSSSAQETEPAAERAPDPAERAPDRAAQPAAGAAGAAGEPVPAGAPVAPAAAQQQDWGAADDGWRAAQALAAPASAEVTAAGLPRRKPRALLVPGAAGAADGVAPTSAPVRSAELIRGRLSSYQQGVREGRQNRRNLERNAGAPHQQQDAAEETT